ncbi:MAG: radical SAM family heme chaperone HemW [SAR202 cluster bacterium]|nr:radical SAM family heme chaperone HemW [SAR202 cluster bacterium]|tara:strand:+ start:5435 stop:6625 length:1191 start_codon:yes stop_codon:yes gene_type:complete
MPIGLYIHIPFCETKCSYCDFNTYSGIENLLPKYIEAICTEIKLWGHIISSEKINTIFLGGGTPSYIPPESLGEIFQTINEEMDTTQCTEITIESNPNDLADIKKLEYFREIGINRISIGIQSFNDNHLKKMSRRHSAIEGINAIKNAESAGFTNINIDLMFGLPNQTKSEWLKTLEIIPTLPIQHVSIYCLTVEENTPLFHQINSGIVANPDQDLAAEMYEITSDFMKQHNFRHYEISNWAKNNMLCTHNLTYWKNQQFIGIGPGAHSSLFQYRFSNIESPKRYIQKLKLNENFKKTHIQSENIKEILHSIPTTENFEKQDSKTMISDTLIMGLRLDNGININEIEKKFNIKIEKIFPGKINQLVSQNLILINNNQIKLSEKGKLLGNEVFLNFL